MVAHTKNSWNRGRQHQRTDSPVSSFQPVLPREKKKKTACTVCTAVLLIDRNSCLYVKWRKVYYTRPVSNCSRGRIKDRSVSDLMSSAGSRAFCLLLVSYAELLFTFSATECAFIMTLRAAWHPTNRALPHLSQLNNCNM